MKNIFKRNIEDIEEDILAETEESEDEATAADSLKNARSFVLIMLLGILCVYAFLGNSGSRGQSLPMVGGKGVAVVLTGSMEPNLPVDSLIFVSREDEYKKGDVVVVQDYYNLVVHRIVEINESEVITKGDANNTEDKPCEVSSIRGKVTGHLPYVGAAVRIMKTPFGSMLLIGVVLLLWALGRRNSNGEDEEDEENEADEENKDE